VVVVGSNCCEWNNCAGIEETQGEMGKDGTKVEDVEEDEIFDTGRLLGAQATPNFLFFKNKK
jgi:hypothetical protein